MRLVLKNEGETHVAMKETTAYFMNQMLTSVVQRRYRYLRQVQRHDHRRQDRYHG